MDKILTLVLIVSVLLSFAAVAPASQQAADPVVAPFELPSSGYLWSPQIAPQGPVMIIVSLPQQRAYVYRNGIRIGLSKVSTGKPGHETPTGVFEILQKSREHYSNLYDNAPMPFMQRLTWDGIALHAGQVPGHPASHGCIRLPYAFSEALFAITSRGMTVIVTDKMIAPVIVSPGLFVPSAAAPVLAGTYEIPALPAYRWVPALAERGPIAILLSTRDQEVRVLRNAVEIGRAPVTLRADQVRGTSVYVLLDDDGPAVDSGTASPALRWQQVALGDDHQGASLDLRAMMESGQLDIDPDFVERVRDALVPGTTVLVTDQPLQQLIAGDLSVLSGEQPATASP